MQIKLTLDDALLIDNYGMHWREMGVAENDIRGDWRAEAERFLGHARQHCGLAAYLAEVDGEPAGTACCHIVPRAFPAFRTVDAPVVGYIWSVYVKPVFRGQGLGSLLVSACTQHLRSNGCSRALLHAGERSAPLYRRLGFSPTDEFSVAL
ncbi:GNAT family N-acetyltransferase [Porphyrobacter sp. GA68]|uniref:GNAT family N-acetyltransferase n=1 Tax=Porphyrobacter sp. GA68 TaxID=2883480 RepID=UPI001D18DB63|nr:GNAT family N-acetyltransferase [Porphyrobacter sp. GA68]